MLESLKQSMNLSLYNIRGNFQIDILINNRVIALEQFLRLRPGLFLITADGFSFYDLY